MHFTQIMTKNLFSKNYALVFDKYRTHSDFILSKYVDFFCKEAVRYGNGIKVLDAGCGSGQFSIPFSMGIEPFDGKLIALDFSEYMLSLLKKKYILNQRTNLSILNEDLSLISKHNLKFNIVWMSDFIHLFKDLSNLVSSINSVLYNSSSIMIRFSSLKQLRSYEWGNFFPIALNYDLQRHHDTEEIYNSLKDIGFSDFSLFEIDETRLVNKNEYICYFSHKYLSCLRVISDDEFSKGIYAIMKKYLDNRRIKRNAKTSLLIARRRGL